MKSHKKSQGIQFNWIFVLVAGVVILIFFTSFGLQLKSLSEKRTNTRITIAINDILDPLAAQASYTEINPQIGTFKAQFLCDGFAINKESVRTNKLIFGPSETTTNELLILTRGFKYPFKIADFFFITSPNINYYIISNNQNILELIPEDSKINLQLISSEQEIYTDNNKIITPKNEPELITLARLFSDDFECLNEKIQDKIKNIAFIYKQKALQLQRSFPSCQYSTIRSSLEKIQTLDNVYKNLELINKQNQDLYSRGCPDVF